MSTWRNLACFKLYTPNSLSPPALLEVFQHTKCLPVKDAREGSSLLFKWLCSHNDFFSIILFLPNLGHSISHQKWAQSCPAGAVKSWKKLDVLLKMTPTPYKCSTPERALLLLSVQPWFQEYTQRICQK